MHIIGLILGLISAIFLVRTKYADFNYSDIFESFTLNFFLIPYVHNHTVYSFGEMRGTWGELFMLNPPDWSLFFEMIVSVFFVYLAKIRNSSLRLVCAISFLLFIATGVATMYAKNELGFTAEMGWGRQNIWGGFPRVFFGFTLGIILSESSEQWKKISLQRFNRFGTTLIYLFLMICLSLPANFHGIYSIFFLIIIAPLMIFLGAKLEETGEKSIKLTDILGRLSYPLYCVHYPVGRMVYYWSNVAKINPWATFCLAIAASISIAWIMGEYLDAPLRSIIATWQSRRRASRLTPPAMS